jgi:8-oxo-dGTP pyrophosphatase MutT (NUDIX family)
MVGEGSGRDGRRFLDRQGAEMAFDGASPITWRLSAYVLVVRDGRVLMVRQHAERGGRWGLPGGRVEAEESLVEGAERECREETGYRFVASSPAPFDVQEAWFGGGPRGTRSRAYFLCVFRKNCGMFDVVEGLAGERIALRVLPYSMPSSLRTMRSI